MKALFVEVKYKGKVELTTELFDKLPSIVVLCSNIQYLDFLASVRLKLEAAGKTVILFKSRHGQYPGQILGCDVFKFEAKLDNSDEVLTDGYGFLYLGDGLFHPTALLFRNEMPVIMYEPRGKKVTVLDQSYLGRLKKQKNARLAKFIESKNIGILVTRKPGQNQNRPVEQFRSAMANRGKNILVFLTDNINFMKLEDFNCVDSWVNTGCPRIVQDFNCVNLRDLKEIGFFSSEKMVF